MPINGKRLLKKGVFKKLQKSVSSIGNCGICHKPMTGVHPDEVRRVGDEPVHDDCYFDELGAGIEQHPIGHPGMHRGH